MTITETIATSKMSSLQIRAVILAIGLVILDGYDVTVISFTAPYIAQEYHASASLLGLVLSGSLIGMFIGSVLLGPVADRIGRRNMAVISTITVAVGMAIGPIGRDMAILMVSRIVTGIGLGALVASVGVIVAEYSNRKRYPFVMALFAAGINIGAVLGAVIVGPIINLPSIASLAYPWGGWRFAFVVGAALAVVAIVASSWLFPESIAWMAEGRRKDSLQRLNALLAKIGQPAMNELPAKDSGDRQAEAKGSVRMVFTPGLRWKTIVMILAYICYMIVFYFITNWMPTRVTDMNGGDLSLAAPAITAFSLGGIIGTAIFGAIAAKVSPRILTPIFLVIGFGTMLWFAAAHGTFGALFPVILIMGFFVSAGTGGFYVIVPKLYPTLARATGYGVVIGAGRLGGIAAPILAGFAFAAGWSTPLTFVIFAIPLLIASVAVLVLHFGVKRSATPELAE